MDKKLHALIVAYKRVPRYNLLSWHTHFRQDHVCPLSCLQAQSYIIVFAADRDGLMSQQPVKYVAICQSYWLSAIVFFRFFILSFQFTKIKTLKWNRNGKEFLVFTSYQKNRDWVGSISAWNHEATSWSEKV